MMSVSPAICRVTKRRSSPCALTTRAPSTFALTLSALRISSSPLHHLQGDLNWPVGRHFARRQLFLQERRRRLERPFGPFLM